MSKDELIEFLKSSLELEVEYGDEGKVEIILTLGGEVVDSVEIDLGGDNG